MIAKALPGQLAPVCISYLRFSKAEQARGDSMRRQTARTVAWSERNGIPLDNSLSFADRGISAFRGRNATEGALGDVLAAIESGRIWPGCYLSIENLDRLSRQEPLESVALMQRILRANVRIVVHSPMEQVYDENSASETHTLFLIVSEFIRAHQESKRKSGLLGEAWVGKRAKATSVGNKTKLTARCPFWLEPVRESSDQKSPVVDFVPIAERVEIVKRVLQLSIDGHGNTAICRILNAEKLPTIGKASHWKQSTIGKLLQDRAMLGEYQPHRIDNSDGRRVRIATGDAIADYFPAIVSEKTFYQAQAAITGRRLPRGKQNSRIVNLFTGLLFDVRDGEPCTVLHKGRKSIGHSIVNSAAAVGVQSSNYLSFPYFKFEDAVLTTVADLDIGSVMPRKANTIAKQIADAADDVVAIEQRIAEIKAKTKGKNRNVGILLDLLAESDEELTTAKNKLETLKRQQASPATDGLNAAKKLIEQLRISTPSEVDELRTKIRNVVRAFIERIDLLIVKINKNDRALIAEIRTKGGKSTRLEIATAVDAPAPDELCELELSDYANWPKEWKATSFTVTTDPEAKVLELDDRGFTLGEICTKLGLKPSRVSRIRLKHGRRKLTFKPSNSKQVMTWSESARGWVKQHQGKRYFVGCGTLKQLYPRLVKSSDRDGTLSAANRWWAKTMDEMA